MSPDTAQVHPRIRGEKLLSDGMSEICMGSPPHMRGRYKIIHLAICYCNYILKSYEVQFVNCFQDCFCLFLS